MSTATPQDVADVLSQLSPEVQSKFTEEHRSLRASAAAIGEALPLVTVEGVLEEPPVEAQAPEDPADFVLPPPSEVHISLVYMELLEKQQCFHYHCWNLRLEKCHHDMETAAGGP